MSELQLDPPWKQAVEDVQKQFEYGDVIPHDWLMNAFRIERAKRLEDVDKVRFAWLQAITEFRELLSVKYRKELRPVRPVSGAGYQIIPPNQQTKYAQDEGRDDIRKALCKWERRLINIEERMLSLEQSQFNAQQRSKLAALRSFQKKQIRDDSGK